MGRRKPQEDDDDDVPYTGPMGPMPWENEVTASAVHELLEAIEAPLIDADTKYVLQRIYYRRNQFGKDGAGAVVMICRCICESHGNEGALVALAVEAVADCVRLHGDKGLSLIEAFDSIPILKIVEQMRDLEIFKESSIGRYLGYSLCNKLARLLNTPADAPADMKGIERRTVARVQLGLELLKLRENNGATFEKLARQRFNVDPWAAPQQRAMKVAEWYGNKPDVVARASFQVLYELCSASVDTRQQFERKIANGEKVTGKMISAAARGDRARASGSPKRKAA